MKSDNKFEQIERYLDGSMSAEERVNFQQALAGDEALRKEVEFQKNMETLLAHQPEDDLRQNLQQLDKKYAQSADNSSKRWLGGLFLVLLLGAGFWHFQAVSEELATPILENKTEETEARAPIEKMIEEVEQSTIESPVKEEKAAEKETSIPKSNTPQSKSQPQPKTTPMPIAANFVPNEILEKRLGNLRGGAMEVTDFKQEFMVKEGQINFEIKGLFIAKNGLDESAILLHIFNNKMADYEAFKPVFSKELTVEVTEGKFDLNQKIAIDAGLYYVQIEDEIGEVLYLGKFLVE